MDSLYRNSETDLFGHNFSELTTFEGEAGLTGFEEMPFKSDLKNSGSMSNPWLKPAFYDEVVKYKHAVRCYCADSKYGKSVSDMLHLNFERVKMIAAGNYNSFTDM